MLVQQTESFSHIKSSRNDGGIFMNYINARSIFIIIFALAIISFIFGCSGKQPSISPMVLPGKIISESGKIDAWYHVFR